MKRKFSKEGFLFKKNVYQNQWNPLTKNFSRLINIFYYSFRIWYKWLEDRGAQAPFILALAEGFRGPSAPFGGLRPLLWGLRPLLEAYGLSQYHQWISQLEYMLFDTQHVEIGPKMAEIVQIAWKLREICVKLHEEVREIAWKYHQWISRLEYILFDTQHVYVSQTRPEVIQGDPQERYKSSY